MPEFKDLSSEKGLHSLNDFLSHKMYIDGFKPSAHDITVYAKVNPCVDCDKFPHVSRWFNHIASFPPKTRARWCGKVDGGGKGAKEEKKSEKKKDKKEKKEKKENEKENEKEKGKQNEKQKDKEKEKDKGKTAKPKEKEKEKEEEAEEDEKNMDFDSMEAADTATKDEDSDDEESKRIQAIGAAKRAADEQAGKKKIIAKSTLILDVKPESDETELDHVLELIKQISMNGLEWKPGVQKVKMVYGLFKLRVMCQIVDDLILTDDIIEQIEKLEGVQSVDVFAFNKV